jgi:hypothetical protein
MDYTYKDGDKVKINVDKYANKNDIYTTKFLKFIDENRDTVFTVKRYKTNSSFWVLEEEPMWIIHEDNLIIVDKNRDN